MITIGGMFSGLDTNSIIQQLTQLNRQPAVNLQVRQAAISNQDSAFGFVQSSLQTLRSRLTSLSDPALLSRKSASVSETGVGAAAATDSAAAGSFQIEIVQVATNSQLSGGKASQVPAASATLGAVFGADVGGTVTINGTTVTLDASMTLQSAAAALEAATGPGGSATYDAGTGRFSLESAEPLLLGSGSSTFFQRAQLFNNATCSVASSTAVGRLNASATLATTDPTVTAGSLRINGVDIAYSTSDTLTDVLQRITASEAGVVATYDAYQDKIQLSSRSRGALAITVEDVGGGNLADRLNFRSGNTGEGTVTLGRNTTFRIDGGAERTSVDGTLDENELGLAGVTFTASRAGTTTVTVGNDVAGVSKVLNDFVQQYNSVQAVVASYIQVDPSNAANNGALANDTTLTFLPRELRSAVADAFGSGTVRMLEDLGIVGNSSDNTLSAVNESALRAALEENPDEVASLLSPTGGLVERLGRVLDAYEGTSGSVIDARRNALTNERSRLDQEIAQIETRVQAETEFLRAQFAALEAASSQANQFSSFFSQPSG